MAPALSRGPAAGSRAPAYRGHVPGGPGGSRGRGPGRPEIAAKHGARSLCQARALRVSNSKFGLKKDLFDNIGCHATPVRMAQTQALTTPSGEGAGWQEPHTLPPGPGGSRGGGHCGVSHETEPTSPRGPAAALGAVGTVSCGAAYVLITSRLTLRAAGSKCHPTWA